MDDANNLCKYKSTGKELDTTYSHIAKSIRIRSKCDRYEHGGKLYIWKKIRKGTRRAKHNETLIIDDAEATDQTSILDHIKDFYEAVFKKREQKTTVEIKCFLNAIDVPRLSEDQVKPCKEDLTEKVLCKSLRSMQNDKYPINNDVTKDFHETIWDELKEIFVDSVKEAKEIGNLRTSQ